MPIPAQPPAVSTPSSSTSVGVYHPQADSESLFGLREVGGVDNPWYRPWLAPVVINRSSRSVTVVWADEKHSIRDIDFTLGLTAPTAGSVGLNYTPSTDISMDETLLPPGCFIRLPVGTRLTLLQGDHRPVSKNHTTTGLVAATTVTASASTTAPSTSSSSAASKPSSTASSTSTAPPARPNGTSAPSTTPPPAPTVALTTAATTAASTSTTTTMTAPAIASGTIELEVKTAPPAPLPGDNVPGQWWMDQSNYLCISHYLHKPLVITDASQARVGQAATVGGLLLWQQHDPNNSNPDQDLHWGCSANPKGSFRLHTHHWVVNDYTEDVYAVVSTEKTTLQSMQFLFGVTAANAVSAKADLNLQRNNVASYYRLPPQCALKVYPDTHVMFFTNQTSVDIAQGPGPIREDWSVAVNPGDPAATAPVVLFRPAHEHRLNGK